MNIKLKIARAQLGTALSLFLRNKDPLSVQALACGGSEVIQGLADQQGLPTLTTHILKHFPEVDLAEIYRIRNRHWNAIKHFYNRDNKTPRNDEELMTNFSDTNNDAVLFSGWLDYQLFTKRLPVEVQVFQVWWYATNEPKMNPRVDPTPFRTAFPNIMSCDRHEQKRRLKRSVEKYLKVPALLRYPMTEQDPLIPNA